MKKIIFVFASVLMLSSCCRQAPKEESLKLMTPVSFSSVEINDAFWTPRLLIHKDVTLPVCIDQIENQTGRIRNFENAAKGEGEHSGIYFDALTLKADAAFQVTKLPKQQWWGHELMQISARSGEEELTLIPYFAWDNREAGKMKVWIPFYD